MSNSLLVNLRIKTDCFDTFSLTKWSYFILIFAQDHLLHTIISYGSERRNVPTIHESLLFVHRERRITFNCIRTNVSSPIFAPSHFTTASHHKRTSIKSECMRANDHNRLWGSTEDWLWIIYLMYLEFYGILNHNLNFRWRICELRQAIFETFWRRLTSGRQSSSFHTCWPAFFSNLIADRPILAAGYDATCRHSHTSCDCPSSVVDLLLIFDNFYSPKYSRHTIPVQIFATKINLIISRSSLPLSTTPLNLPNSTRFNELFLGICRDVVLAASHNDVNAHNKMRLGFVIIP